VNIGSMNDMITLAHITDGTANTLLIGEKLLNPVGLGGFQGDDNEGYSSGWDHDVIRLTDRLPMPDAYAKGPGWGEERFGSAHASGVMSVFCDGSVKLIRYAVDSTTFRNLGVRNDGAVLGDY